MDGLGGSDSNDGLTRQTAKLTLSAGYTQLAAGPSGSTLIVVNGTHKAEWTGATGTRNIGLAPGVIIDMASDAVLTSAFSPNGGTLNILGVPASMGGAQIKNCLNNGVGPGTTAEVNVHDVQISACDDGVSAHNTSTLRAYRCTVSACTKGAFSHIDATTTYHEDCTFTGLNGAANGVGVNLNTGTATFVGCTFLPPSGSSVAMPTFTSTGGTILTRCKVGTAAMTGTWSGILAWDYVTATDTYLKGFALSRGWNSTFTRCYGIVTIRARGNASDGAVTVENCVFSTGHTSGRFLNADFRSAPTEIGGRGTIRNSIFVGHTEAIHAGATNVTDVNANWQFLNNCLFDNSANYASGLTADGVDVTTDPLLVDTTTDAQSGWKYSALSPCIGAGVGGANIGIGTA